MLNRPCPFLFKRHLHVRNGGIKQREENRTITAKGAGRRRYKEVVFPHDRPPKVPVFSLRS